MSPTGQTMTTPTRRPRWRSNVGAVTWEPTPRVDDAFGLVALMKVVTVSLALLLVALGVLASHPGQATRDEAGHLAGTALVAEQQRIVVDPTTGTSVAISEEVVIGLATGCVLLAACCALGLALLSARKVIARVLGRLQAPDRSLRIEAVAPTGLFACRRSPSLTVLSISRT